MAAKSPSFHKVRCTICRGVFLSYEITNELCPSCNMDARAARTAVEHMPFDLEAAKRGDAIVNQWGMSVKFIAHVSDVNKLACVVIQTGDRVTLFSNTGYRQSFTGKGMQLYMAAKKQPASAWANIWFNPITYETAAHCYSDENAARNETAMNNDWLCVNRAFEVRSA